MSSIYETLMQLPLFAGVSQQIMQEIAGKHKLHFLKYANGDIIESQGAQCTHLKCIISGKVHLTLDGKNKCFTLEQTLSAPDLIASDFLFGRTTQYPSTATAIGNVGILQISKPDLMNIISTDMIFMLNFINMLSMQAQTGFNGVLSLTEGSPEQLVCYMIMALTQNNSTDITLRCPQSDMHKLFGLTKTQFSTVLENLQAKGVVKLAPSAINVIDRRALFDILSATGHISY